MNARERQAKAERKAGTKLAAYFERPPAAFPGQTAQFLMDGGGIELPNPQRSTSP